MLMHLDGSPLIHDEVREAAGRLHCEKAAGFSNISAELLQARYSAVTIRSCMLF